MGPGTWRGIICLVASILCLVIVPGCRKKKEIVNEQEELTDVIDVEESVDVESEPRDQVDQIVEDLGDGRYLVYENQEALEVWIKRSSDYELLGAPHFGVGVRLYIDPTNVSVPEDHDWDELAGLILWGFAAVKEPGDRIPCCGGEVVFVNRIGSQMVHENGRYLGGEEDWLVNEFVFTNDFASIEGVVALAYEGGDFYFQDIVSDIDDEQVLLRLAAMSLDDFEEFYLYENVEISDRTKNDLLEID